MTPSQPIGAPQKLKGNYSNRVKECKKLQQGYLRVESVKIPKQLLKSAPPKYPPGPVGKTPQENSYEELLFTPYLVTLGTQNLLGNSQLRSDGCSFSVELRRDYPQTIPLIAKTVT
ncbi:hypothetical protein AVEN_139967-1 [Araneus ventricosus]|uniref:Uncharacterized protein n=1 Tax=Araneus ventricosus TaxID=182803 RepID=A0A4Y2U9P7_ARAVE|nr:hypothetical protein AVEN_139967-1 [Araneus ventricosus]